jgi:hypothetical protein
MSMTSPPSAEPLLPPTMETVPARPEVLAPEESKTLPETALEEEPDMTATAPVLTSSLLLEDKISTVPLASEEPRPLTTRTEPPRAPAPAETTASPPVADEEDPAVTAMMSPD